MSQQSDNPNTQEAALSEEKQQADSRREAIKKIGKYSAFATPILLGMISRPARAS